MHCRCSATFVGDRFDGAAARVARRSCRLLPHLSSAFGVKTRLVDFGRALAAAPLKSYTELLLVRFLRLREGVNGPEISEGSGINWWLRHNGAKLRTRRTLARGSSAVSKVAGQRVATPCIHELHRAAPPRAKAHASCFGWYLALSSLRPVWKSGPSVQS